jgi:tetratricopeptide (TPR) repeat protein
MGSVMDQFSAHLDRGWDLVQRGDPLGAEQSARRALELDSQSPEAYNLLGYVAALRGDYEEAIDNYRQAISLDDAYLEAMLNAAEIYVHPLGEYDEAIELCEQALEIAETDDEIVDALLLCFDSYLGKGDTTRAEELCGRFPQGPFENPTHTFLVGRACFEIGKMQRAAELIEASIKVSPNNPDAYYYLGLVHDERGNMAEATRAFLRSRELDLELAPPPWSLMRDTFQLTVQRALQSLDQDLRDYLPPNQVYVADLPGVEVIVDGVDPRASTMLDALRRDDGEQPTARLFVYQRNVERLAGSLEGLEPEIRASVTRELKALFSPESEAHQKQETSG